jgi:2-polyprenyl-3-methyl-5-hydroxy-6-metoxy-1,4-benzoquinol methylase
MNQEISRAFDAEVCRHACRYRESGLTGTSRIILDRVRELGVSGKTVLELGCGIGGLSIELLREGARSVKGIDLSTSMIAHARELASSSPFKENATFLVGDGADTQLDPHQVVILDKVVCCYPNMDAILKNSLEACKGIYCVALPQDNGAWGALAKLVLPLEVLYQRLRGCSFRGYLHDTEELDGKVRSHGFTELETDAHWQWVIKTYKTGGTNSPV